MAEIHVLFQKNKRAVILEDPEAVMQKEILNWHFTTRKTPVKSVRISFAKPSAKFFPHVGKAAKSEITKDVANGQTIWGRAPFYFKKGPPRTRADKYTIEAFDQRGRKLRWATNDPTIRTDGP